jgi:PAS domain S-box-containing protein
MAASQAGNPVGGGKGLAAPVDRLLVESLPHMVWTARRDGSVDYVNRRVSEYSGRPPAMLLGTRWRTLVHPQDLASCLERQARAGRQGEPYEHQVRLLRADGEYRWHSVAANPLMNAAGHVVKWLGTWTDVDDQVRAMHVFARRASEPPASTSEQRLRSIMMLSSDYYWETDASHRFTVLEPGGRFGPVTFAQTRLGLARWEVPSVLPDADGWRAHRATLEAHLPFRDFETARRGADGIVHYYSNDGEPVFDETGAFAGYRGVGREITARKLAEQALQERGRRFRAFLECMPAIAWIKDSRLHYAWVSASYGRAFGKPREAVRGRDDFAAWPADIAARNRRGDERALGVNGPVQSFEVLPNSEGQPRRWLVVRFPMPDDTGALGVAGIGFDVTREGDVRGKHPAQGWKDPIERLSGRERQVLALVVDGYTSAEIGGRLGLSPKSVDTYRSRIMTKLELEDLPSLVKFALRHGLTSRT